jgi:hypothetical protein
MLKDKIVSDLKTAMLSGDKQRAEALKMVKSAILYKEVESNVREAGLADEQVIETLLKEAKKRAEAAEMYKNADRAEQAASEQYEYDLIKEYLPAEMTDEALADLVKQTVADAGDVTMKDMGKIIGQVKAKAGNSADGGRIASMVKQTLEAQQ